jgi:hypothetical protein
VTHKIVLAVICKSCRSTFEVVVEQIYPTRADLLEALRGLGQWPCPTCGYRAELEWNDCTDAIVAEYAVEMGR